MTEQYDPLWYKILCAGCVSDVCEHLICNLYFLTNACDKLVCVSVCVWFCLGVYVWVGVRFFFPACVLPSLLLNPQVHVHRHVSSVYIKDVYIMCVTKKKTRNSGIR